jgi:membrane protease YdiL (CAAX protease family)
MDRGRDVKVQDRSAIAAFLGLATLISAVFWAIIIATGHVGGGAGHYVEALMWSPALAAFLTVVLCRLDVRSLGLGWRDSPAALSGYLTPLAYAAIAYGVVWLSGLGGFPNLDTIAALAKKLGWSFTAPLVFVPLYFLLIATTGMVSSLAHALGEEIGWRGFLAPRMVGRAGFTTGAVLTGLIWAAWHVPILLFADYNSGTPWWFALPCFFIMVVSLSVMLTWLRLKSNSVWPCAILHASHNLFIQAFFTPLTSTRGGITAYVIDEFGLAVPLVTVVFAVFFWSRRGTAMAAAGRDQRTTSANLVDRTEPR